MCLQQRVRLEYVMSFSGLGVSIILVVGAILIVTNMSLPFVVAFFQKRFGVGLHKRSDWILNESLQLQRMAFEGTGQGVWRGTENIVPLTERGEKLYGFRQLRDHGPVVEYQDVDLKYGVASL